MDKYDSFLMLGGLIEIFGVLFLFFNVYYGLMITALLGALLTGFGLGVIGILAIFQKDIIEIENDKSL